MLFKKITSDRDPRDTVVREIRKEFAPYFHSAGQGLKNYAARYPKFLFAMMVINISLSIILCLTCYRPKKEQPVKIVAPVARGFDQLLKATAALRLTISLKKQVDSLMHKKVLTGPDSAALWSDIGKLQQIEPIKTSSHEH